MTQLTDIFGDGTTLENDVLSIPLENFSCPHTELYLLGSVVRKMYEYNNPILATDDTGVTLSDNWGQSLVDAVTEPYTVEMFEYFEGIHFVRQYDFTFES